MQRGSKVFQYGLLRWYCHRRVAGVVIRKCVFSEMCFFRGEARSEKWRMRRGERTRAQRADVQDGSTPTCWDDSCSYRSTMQNLRAFLGSCMTCQSRVSLSVEDRSVSQTCPQHTRTGGRLVAVAAGSVPPQKGDDGERTATAAGVSLKSPTAPGWVLFFRACAPLLLPDSQP